jgi:hypothetical protein
MGGKPFSRLHQPWVDASSVTPVFSSCAVLSVPLLASQAQPQPSHQLVLPWPAAPLLEELIGTGLLLLWLQARVEQLLCSRAESAPAALLELQQAAMAPATQTWDSWCEQRRLDPACLDGLAAQRQQLEDLKQGWFAKRAHELFLEQGSLLDQVRFSVLQTTDPDLAQEWFFKLQDGESEYADLALTSLGLEQHSGGSVGPVRVRDLQSPLDLLLRRATPGIVQPPLLTPAGRTWVVRLDQRLPAQWNPRLCAELVEQLYREWLNATLKGWLDQQPRPGAQLVLERPHG